MKKITTIPELKKVLQESREKGFSFRSYLFGKQECNRK